MIDTTIDDIIQTVCHGLGASLASVNPMLSYANHPKTDLAQLDRLSKYMFIPLQIK